MRLGVRPLWLSEGKGVRYERSGPVAVLPGVSDPKNIDEVRRLFLLREQSAFGATELVTEEAPRADYHGADRQLLAKLRSRPPAFQALVENLIDMADRGQT